jgi:serine/threonine protein kinase
MEFLNGEDLNNKIKKNGPLSDTEIFSIFSQTLSAFEFAHENGIVHRDIKPSNIFILPNGHVKILDFGIAKLFGQGNEMTSTGTQLGTPIYMSPEQVKADKSIDHRSDIYSLGVTMFFAINGKAPYNSNTDSQFDIFTKIVYEPLPNFKFNSKYNEIVLTACKKNREERFQNCSEYLTILKSINNSKINDKTLFDLEEKSKNSQSSSTSKQSENIKNKSDTKYSLLNVNKKNKNRLLVSVMFIVLIGVFIVSFLNYSDNEKKEIDEGSGTKETKIQIVTEQKTAETNDNQTYKKEKGEKSDDLYKKYQIQFNSICSKIKYLESKKKSENDKTERNSDTIKRITTNIQIKQKELEATFDLWKKNGLGKEADDPLECECN